MKEKKISVSQVLVLLLAFIMLFAFSGCANPNEATEALFEQVKTNNSKNIEKYYMGEATDFSFLQNAYYNESNQTEEHRHLYNSMMKKLTAFTVSEGQRETFGNEGSLRVTFTAYDFSNILTPGEAAEWKAAVESQDASKLSLYSVRNIQARVDALDKQTSTKYMKLPFAKGDNGKWQVKPLNEEALNALSGGFYDLVK